MKSGLESHEDQKWFEKPAHKRHKSSDKKINPERNQLETYGLDDLIRANEAPSQSLAAAFRAASVSAANTQLGGCFLEV